MLNYNNTPDRTFKHNNKEISVFSSIQSENKDETVIEEFGNEWIKFNKFDFDELNRFGDSYFKLILDKEKLNTYNCLDIGCGTGRWAYYLADKVNFVEAVDPSDAVYSAANLLDEKNNVRITNADLANIPFAVGSFDLVYSLGVLHHIPDTNKAIEDAVKFVKPGGYFLVYLYYKLDNRGFLFKSLYYFSDIIRKGVSKLPHRLKLFTCDILAFLVYLPIVYFTKGLKFLFPKRNFWKKIPLASYAEFDSSINVLRNDTLDRFGTRLENRFTRNEIKVMMENAGLKNINIPNELPYWVAIGQK